LADFGECWPLLAAVRSFTLAKNAETEHAKVLQHALNQLGRGTNSDYYVCLVCGYTMPKVPEKNCPSRHNGAEKFVKPS
jgi:rubrerythrin